MTLTQKYHDNNNIIQTTITTLILNPTNSTKNENNIKIKKTLILTLTNNTKMKIK